MQKVAVLILFAFCAFTALSLAEDTNKSKPPSTMSSAEAFLLKSTITTVNPQPTKPTTLKPTTPKPTTPKPTTPKPTTPKPTTPKPTTPKPTTPKPTTPKPTTPKPTTPKPTTPKPTTPKPTTPKPTTPKPTTPKPTTPKPTTPKPTTTVAPKPTPATNLTVGKYNVMTAKGEICLMAQMALQIRLQKEKENGTFIVQPEKTKASGECMDNKASLKLTFDEGFISFGFIKSVANNTVYVDTVSFSLNYPLTKTGAQTYSANNQSLHLFAAKIGHSYSCKKENLNMGNSLFLDVNKDQMQAFNISKNAFGYPDPCPADKPDYRVAIAVGVTLLVLIVIVVIVYLLGRKRRTDGYQSL